MQKPIGDELKQFAMKYRASSVEDKRRLREEAAVNDRTVRRWVEEGVKLCAEATPQNKSVMDEICDLLGKVPSINKNILPPGEGDEEQAVLVLSDLHCGRLTVSFNSKVLAHRIGYLREVVSEIVSLHRKAYPIKHLNIFALGDWVQGEGLHHQPLENFEFGYPGQVAVLSKIMTEFFINLLEEFETITVWCVGGNHGRPKVAYGTTQNWDSVVYELLAATFSNNNRIKFVLPTKIAEKDYQVAKVWDWKFLLKHGAGIPMVNTIPWYGITTRALRWKQALPEHFDAVIMGHFHTLGDIIFNTVPILMNGTAVSDDEYPRRALGMEAETKMWFFGVHPHRPMTWRYAIELDENKG